MKSQEFVTVRAVLASLCRHPFQLLIANWNWKSAILSSLIRSIIFFAANFDAGRNAALAAMLTELIYRGCTAGFYASLTQAFRHVRPVWQANLAAMVLLPLVSHSTELFIHWVRATPNLFFSILSSAIFTSFSTAYHLFAMRNGAMIVGLDAQSLRSDLQRTPRILFQFIQTCIEQLFVQPVKILRRSFKRRFAPVAKVIKSEG